MPTPIHFISELERKLIEKQRVAANGKPEHFFTPGMAWGCHKYNNPLDVKRCKERTAKGLKGFSFISVEYWRDWADKRTPIIIVVPGGYQWLIDGKQNSREGWTIIGETPNLTALEPVKVPGYSGWLIDGVLTDGPEKPTGI